MRATMMNYKIEIEKNASEFLTKLSKSQKKAHAKIDIFIHEILTTCENPCTLQNAKRLTGFADNRWRWRLGDYRIVAKIVDGEFKIIEIIKISKRDESTYKNLK